MSRLLDPATDLPANGLQQRLVRFTDFAKIRIFLTADVPTHGPWVTGTLSLR